MKYHHSVIINRSINEVFTFVTNLENETRWQPEIKSVTLEGPLAAGGTFRETRASFGQQFDWHFLITEFDPPHRITIDTISGTIPYRGSRLFKTVEGGTKVTEVGDIVMPRVLRPFNPLFSWLSKRPQRVAYGRLKKLIESEIAPTSSQL